MRMKPRSAILTTLCFLSSLAAAPAALHAQGLSPLLQGYSVVSRTDGAPVVRTAPLAPPYMAVAFGARLAIMDMTQPSSPVEISSVDLPESPRGFCLFGSQLFIADGNHGLIVLDTSNPASPAFVASYVDRPALAVAVNPNGNFAYACDGSTNIRVIRLKSLGHLKELPGISYTKANFFDLVVVGNYLVAAGGPRGVVVYSLDTPSAPVRVRRVKELRGSKRLALNGRVLAVADDDAGFALIDFPTWDAPRLRGKLPLASPALDCAFLASDSSRVLLGQGTGGFSLVDVSNLDAPRLALQSSSPEPASGVSSFGSNVYLSCGVEGLWLADLSQPDHPALHEVAQGSSGWYGVALSGTTAYVAGDSQLQVWDFSDPYHPRMGAAVSLALPAVDLLVANGMLFASCQAQGVLIFSLADPASPTLLGTYTDSAGAAAQTSVAGNLMAVAMGNQGAQLVDISDPSQPRLMGAFKDTKFKQAFFTGLAFSATDSAVLFATDSLGNFYALDVSSPAAPSEAGKVSLDTGFGKVAVSPDFAFVAMAGARGIQVVKVQNPAKPEKGTVMAGTNTVMLALSGDRVFMCDGQAGLKEFDVSDPANPPEVALAALPGFTSGAAILPLGQVLVTTKEGGLWVLEHASCAGSHLLLPCDGASLPRVSAALFTWVAQAGADYKVQVSIDPSFPEGNKKTRKAANKVSNTSTGSWAPTTTDWDWMIRRSAEGHPLYWRVIYKVNKVDTPSEVRTFDIQ